MKTQIRSKLGQQQKISMQLQNAMKLMAMPALELHAHIQATLDENPLLEIDEAEISLTAGQNSKNTQQVESDWLAQVQSTINLQDHLRAQCDLLSLSPLAYEFAQTIIDSINETGYLQTSLQDLFPGSNAEQLHLIRSILHQIQQFDPPGVAARSLSECLLLQLPQIEDDEVIQIANQIIHHHMKALANNNSEAIADKLQQPLAKVEQAIKAIKSLHPKPGLQIDGKPTQSIVPDVSVKVQDGKIKIDLNAVVPSLKLRQDTLQERADGLLTAAKDFIYHLHLRNQSLAAVSESIVKHQQEFFHHGASALKPLTLEMVAKDTALHVSTLSRMTQQKYMHTPFGVCAMKYFFSSSVPQEDQSELAGTAIQEMIRMLIDQEDRQQPLSDNCIVDILNKKGIAIARRTVAKYRDKMNIPSSTFRKRL
jgi:RNA polymerase sigma-54 factor